MSYANVSWNSWTRNITSIITIITGKEEKSKNPERNLENVLNEFFSTEDKMANATVFN